MVRSPSMTKRYRARATTTAIKLQWRYTRLNGLGAEPNLPMFAMSEPPFPCVPLVYSPYSRRPTCLPSSSTLPTPLPTPSQPTRNHPGVERVELAAMPWNPGRAG